MIKRHKGTELVSIDFRLIALSADAIGCETDDPKRMIWFPLRLVEYEVSKSGRGKLVCVKMPDWLARKENLV